MNYRVNDVSGMGRGLFLPIPTRGQARDVVGRDCSLVEWPSESYTSCSGELFLLLSGDVPSGSLQHRPGGPQWPHQGSLRGGGRAYRADQGGALDRSHPRCPWARLAAAYVLVVALGLLAVVPTPARAASLQSARDKASQLAADVGELDASIGGAVRKYAQATAALQAVRAQIRANTKSQELARGELALARTTLALRAVALYKHADVTPLDAIFTASDFGDLVAGLNMVRSITRSDHDVLRTVVQTSRQLATRAESLVADKRTAQRLVTQRQAEVTQIRARLSPRRTLLPGLRDQNRALAAKQEAAPSSPAQTVPPPGPCTGGRHGGGPGQ